MNFGKIFEIFPGMDTEVLCKLSELSERLPSKVRELVPEASPVQIAAFMNLAEDARQQRMKERRRASVPHKRRVRPEWQQPVSPIVGDEELAADGKQVAKEPHLISDQKTEFMSRLKSSFMLKKKEVMVKFP